MSKASNGPASAAAAWLRGLENGPDAVGWLDRAARLAPEDPRIVLDLARCRLGGSATDKQAAAAAFAQVAAENDSASAWLGLALAQQKLGDTTGAATALAKLLARHCLPSEPGFMKLAAQIARSAGYDGFCGVTAAGEVQKSGIGRLLGEPLDMAALARVMGLVAAKKNGLSGWATRPAWSEAPPDLIFQDASGKQRAVKFGRPLPADDDAPLLPRHSFRISPAQLRGLIPPFSLLGPDGAHLMGSPLDPAMLAIPPISASYRGKLPARPGEHRAPLAIIVPVYRGLKDTQACLAALFNAAPQRAKLILVDDSTPEAALAAWMDNEAAKGRVMLLRHAANRGFAAAVNTALSAAAGHDVLLLNSDTLVPPGAIETLLETAYADAATGSVTPLSNAATILSYPKPGGSNPMPDLAETIRLNMAAAKANGNKSEDIPTGIGFCMLLRHDCLAATGGFRPEIFAQGYGEENDWCLRARHHGFRHRAALGAYVAHRGGVSFGAAARGLMRRNSALIEHLYPGYDALVQAHIQANPLRAARAKIDALRMQAGPKRDAVLLISHSHGGGVARQVETQMEALRARGLRPLLLTTQFPEKPEETPYPWPALLTEGKTADYPNLAFSLPAQKPALLRLLKAVRVKRVIMHHTLGHHPQVRSIAAGLAVPQEIVIHDYASFCPRVNLLTPAPIRYCGEPGIAACMSCQASDPKGSFEGLPVPQLLARSAREFAKAERVIAPSRDTARRIARHFPGVVPDVTAWEDDSEPVRLRPPAAGRRKIVVIGGIGAGKGFDLLADCARDAAARSLPLEFMVVGSSADDAVLLGAGVFVTGHYKEGDAQNIITQCKADLAFLPSILPETWCYTLSEAWRAGLYAVSFDLGAQAERIKATGRGVALPLGLPVPRINDILLEWMPTNRHAL